MDKEERFSWIIFFLIILIPHSVLIASVFLFINDVCHNPLGIQSLKDLLEAIYYIATITGVVYAAKAYSSWKKPIIFKAKKEFYMILKSAIELQKECKVDIEKIEKSINEIQNNNDTTEIYIQFAIISAIFENNTLEKCEILKSRLNEIEFELKESNHQAEINEVKNLLDKLSDNLKTIGFCSVFSNLLIKEQSYTNKTARENVTTKIETWCKEFDLDLEDKILSKIKTVSQ